MKKVLTSTVALLSLAALLFASGCNGYRSRYKAFLFVHSNRPASSFMSFDSFTGTMVFRMKNKQADGKLKYSASLGSGSATVYYDCGGGKTELFSIKDGEEIPETEIQVNKGKVRVIVESAGECKEGEFSFDIDY